MVRNHKPAWMRREDEASEEEPPTPLSVDRRLERLEAIVTSMDRKLDRLLVLADRAEDTQSETIKGEDVAISTAAPSHEAPVSFAFGFTYALH